MNPKLPILTKLEDHFEWSTEHQIALKASDLFCVIEYETEADYFQASHIADPQQERYNTKLAAINIKPITQAYTQANKDQERRLTHFNLHSKIPYPSGLERESSLKRNG